MAAIREAGPGDARRLAAIAEETFRDTFAAVNTEENMEFHCRSHFGEAIQSREIADPNMVTLLCEQGGSLVGFAQLRWGQPPECVVGAAPGEIQRLYVVRESHGQGIAHDLMNACLSEMASHASDVAWLGVWEHNPRAIAFYRKFGFREVGEHVFPLGSDLQRDVIMSRGLAGAGLRERPADDPT